MTTLSTTGPVSFADFRSQLIDLKSQVATLTSQLQASSRLYPFSTFTFTNAGATGRSGPTLSQCISAYSGQTWASNTAYFNMTTQGIQLWTVPATGSYTIACAGAATGGANSFGGRGITLSATITLQQSDVISILIGQLGAVGTGGSSGGGGGSFVVKSSTPLLIAGGGGGFHLRNPAVSRPTSDGQTGTSGGNASDGTGTGGAGGQGGQGSTSGWGSGGGGFLTNGTQGNNEPGSGGSAFQNGGVGGGSSAGGFGGFGAGGGTNGNTGGGGGGGGYSGGGGSGQTGTTPICGGGGGSFNGSVVTGYNTSVGYVTITAN